MKRCTNCQKELPEEMKNCIYCGHDFSIDEKNQLSNLYSNSKNDSEKRTYSKEKKQNKKTYPKREKKNSKRVHKHKAKKTSITNNLLVICLLLLVFPPLGWFKVASKKVFSKHPILVIYFTTLGLALWIQTFMKFTISKEVLGVLEFWLFLDIILFILTIVLVVFQAKSKKNIGLATFAIFCILVHSIFLLGIKKIDYTQLISVKLFQRWQQKDQMDTPQPKEITDNNSTNAKQESKKKKHYDFLVDSNELGPYGKLEIINNNDTIEYYIPAGTYSICIAKSSLLEYGTIFIKENTQNEDNIYPIVSEKSIRKGNQVLVIETNQHITVSDNIVLEFSKSND